MNIYEEVEFILIYALKVGRDGCSSRRQDARHTIKVFIHIDGKLKTENYLYIYQNLKLYINIKEC